MRCQPGCSRPIKAIRQAKQRGVLPKEAATAGVLQQQAQAMRRQGGIFAQSESRPLH
jgi:hypothetical protein